MNSLFEYLPSGEINISPEVLMFKEFSDIWDRDKTKGKKKAKKEVTFVWGICANTDKNIWRDFKDELERAKMIKLDIFGKGSDWKPDPVVLSAIDKYKRRLPFSPLDKMLDSVEKAILKLSDYLDDVDFSHVDDNGKPIHDPKKVRDIISTMGKTMTDYNELKKQIAAGKADTEEQLRGGGSKGLFEERDEFDD